MNKDKSAIIPRINYIDNLRAVSIIGMILCHGALFLTSINNGFSYFFADFIIGGWPAAIFITISGFMLSYKNNSKNISLIKRGILLIIISMLLSVLFARKWTFFLECDVLVILGLLSILYPILKKCNNIFLGVFLIPFLILFAPPLRNILDYYNTWGGGYEYEYSFGIWHIIKPLEEYNIDNISMISLLKAPLINGNFPIFPWLSFALIGIILGRTKVKSLTTLLLSIIIFVLTLLITVINRESYSFYPLSINFNLILISLILFLFTIRNTINFYSFVLTIISKHSLSIYCLHYLVISFVSIFYTLPYSIYGYLFAVILIFIFFQYFKYCEKHNSNMHLEFLLKKIVS